MSHTPNVVQRESKGLPRLDRVATPPVPLTGTYTQVETSLAFTQAVAVGALAAGATATLAFTVPLAALFGPAGLTVPAGQSAVILAAVALTTPPPGVVLIVGAPQTALRLAGAPAPPGKLLGPATFLSPSLAVSVVVFAPGAVAASTLTFGVTALLFTSRA